MNFFRSLKKSYYSLMLHRMRSLLSTLGILFGVAAVIAMLSIGEGAKRETLQQIEQLGINNLIIRQIEQSEEQRHKASEKRSSGLSLKDVQALRDNLPIIDLVAPVKSVEAELIGDVSPEILAVTSSFADLKTLELSEGRFISDKDNSSKNLVCVLGADVANALGRNGHVGQSVRIEGLQFQIVGVLKQRNWREGKIPALSTRNINKCVFIPLGSHLSVIRSPDYKYHMLTEMHLRLANGHEPQQAALGAKRILEVTHRGVEDYQIVIPQELLSQLSRTQRTFNLVLGSIAAISLLVGGIGIMNIMLATVSERTREIGIRRAVGANKGHIIIQFLAETLLLTLTGALLGILCGVIFSLLIGFMAGWTTIVTVWSMLLSLGMASLVGLCSGLYPAVQAAEMNPITALRHE